MIRSILAISLGASTGAVVRWMLGQALNAVYPALPLGTLAANLLGGYLIGLAITVFSLIPGLAPEWRLCVITGFLGALTTFSTFSAEVTAMLQHGRIAWAGLTVCIHVTGSLAMTTLGMITVSVIQHLQNGGY